MTITFIEPNPLKQCFSLRLSVQLLFALLFFIVLSNTAAAQDVIYTVKGAQVKCRVQEVSEDSVSYQPIAQPKSKVQFLAKTEVHKIKYENGYEELFTASQTQTGKTTAVVAAKKEELPFDIIFTTDGRELKVKVNEVEETSINYTLVGNKSIDKLAIANVVGIRYSNGYEEAYNAPADVKQAAAEAKNQNAATQAPVYATDIIKLRDGKEVKGKIVEVDEATVKYTTTAAKNAAAQSFALYEILKIQYANGYEEVYSQYTNPNKPAGKGGDVVAVAAPVAKGSISADDAKKQKADKNKDEKLAAERAKKVKADKEKADKLAAAKGKNSKDNDAQASTAVPVMRGKIYPFAELNKKEHYTSINNALAEPMQVEYLDLSQKAMKSLSPDIVKLKRLVAVNLSGNQLKKFPQELFELPELQYVWLDNVGIQNIKFDDKVMAKLKQSSIIFLSLNNNRLTKIPPALFYLNNLMELRINGNQVSTVAFDKTFNPGVSNLEIIDLSKNRFDEIPDALSKLPLLVRLNLGDNNIKTLEKVAGYKKLRFIKLNNNPLKEVSPAFYNLQAVEEFDLNQTSITTLPDSVSKLSQLRSLILPGSFNRFPTDFGALKLLNELYLTHNRASDLYVKAGKIKRLDEFPRIILNCPRLITIAITGVDIGSLPKDINRLKRLENLYFNDCNLTTLPEELFTLPGLKVLDLSGNRITQVSSSIGELASLEMLNLQNSPLDGGSLLGLRRTLPQAQINYFDTNFGLNFASKPLPPNLRPQFKRLFLACDRNDPNAYYELGQFFEKNGDYGLAEKAFRAVADNRDLEGTGKSVTCLLRMAEIYDDIKGEKSYLSPYKRKVYADYSDYSSTSTNNRAYNIYIQISGIQTRDNVARLAQKKANARINVICNDMADNLQRIFEANNSEIERLIGSSGDMQNLSAAGDKIMNDSQVQGSQGAALFGAAVSIFGKVSSSVKDDKAARLKRDNLSLKEEIADLRSKASHYMSK